MMAEPTRIVSEMRAGLRDIAVASRIFLVVAVLALAGAIGALAWQQGVFTRTIKVSFFAGTADGMNKGMAVKLVGFKVGSVDDISVTPDLRVKVDVRLDEKYRNMIDGDAVIRLAREGVIGGNVLEVRPGSGDRGPVKDAAVLRYEREPALDAAVAALVDQIAPVIADVKQVTSFLASPEGDFRQAIGNANRAAAALVETRSDLRKLIAELGDGAAPHRAARGGRRRDHGRAPQGNACERRRSRWIAEEGRRGAAGHRHQARPEPGEHAGGERGDPRRCDGAAARPRPGGRRARERRRRARRGHRRDRPRCAADVAGAQPGAAAAGAAPAPGQRRRVDGVAARKQTLSHAVSLEKAFSAYRMLLATLLALTACGSVPLQSDSDARRERQAELSERAQRAIGRGEVARAAGYYREALRIAESTEDFAGIGVYALNLAATYQALDEPALAQAALDKVLADPARFEPGLVVEAAGRRALLALQARQLDAAGEWLERAERDCAPPACRARVALTNVRGQLLLEGGNAAQARTVMVQALAGARAEGNQEEEANALRVDGRAAARLGGYDEALALLDRALALDKQLGLPRKIALDLIALAEVALARGERDFARDYARRALSVSRAAGSKRQQADAQRLLESVP